MSLAQITDKIKADAQKQADEILSKAKENADFITRKAAEDCDAIRSEFEARFEMERPEIFKRREIVAGLDTSKMFLQAKRDLIADVYAATLKELVSLPKDKYLSFCESLLEEAAKTKDETVFIGKDEKNITDEWVASYNSQHKTNFKLSPERRAIDGGFILVRGRVSVDCSWNMLVKVMQEKQESDVVKRLFPSA
ncbi:MAG: V-type ATP synthase subunit E family protein [Synergistes sp.]|nr:V-type ATP synthase subunit E family protein [Synergistes sp.]